MHRKACAGRLTYSPRDMSQTCAWPDCRCAEPWPGDGQPERQQLFTRQQRDGARGLGGVSRVPTPAHRQRRPRRHPAPGQPPAAAGPAAAGGDRPRLSAGQGASQAVVRKQLTQVPARWHASCSRCSSQRWSSSPRLSREHGQAAGCSGRSRVGRPHSGCGWIRRQMRSAMACSPTRHFCGTLLLDRQA